MIVFEDILAFSASADFSVVPALEGGLVHIVPFLGGEDRLFAHVDVFVFNAFLAFSALVDFRLFLVLFIMMVSSDTV